MKRNIIIIFTIIIAVVAIISLYIVAKNTKIENDEKFNITTSFYPIHIAVLNITDGVKEVSVNSLTNEATGCLHDYTLSTNDLASLSNSDALVINGAGMENFLDKIIEGYENLNIIDSSESINLIKESTHEDDINHDHTNEYNPHIFASVKNHIKQVNNIANKLSELNPINKIKYEDNAKKYIEKLENIDREILETVNSLKYKDIVTFHKSFDYFAQEFSLNVIATIETEHGKMPSASEVAILVNKIKQDKARAIFVEPDYNKKLAETIAKEANIKVYILNPASSGKIYKNAYIDIMKENMNVLKQALS